MMKTLSLAALTMFGAWSIAPAQTVSPMLLRTAASLPLPGSLDGSVIGSAPDAGSPAVSATTRGEGLPGSAATVVEADLPDAPDAASDEAQQQGQAATGGADPAAPGKPSKRILGIVPNYRSVGVGAKLPPQTVRQKLGTAVSDSIDPASFVLAGLVAGYNYGRGNTPEFGSGGVAFGRYYWHSLADQDIENLSVEFLVPALTHEDTRYYTLGKGGARKRLTYSLTRILVTRTDSGKQTVNLGELLGAGLAAGASSRYYPASQRDAGSVLSAYALDLGIDAASYVVREFDADLSHVFSRKGHE